jgi:hypothetical protein
MVVDPAVAESLSATRAAWFRAFRGVPATQADRVASFISLALVMEPTERVDVAVVG